MLWWNQTKIPRRRTVLLRGSRSGHGGEKKAGSRSCPPGKEAPRRRQGLFEFFGHDGELQLGLGERLHHDGFGALRRSIARGSHFADEKILRAFEHFLFAEGKGLAA